MENINSITATIGAVGALITVGGSVWAIYKDFRKNRTDETSSLTKTAVELSQFLDKEFDECRQKLKEAHSTIDKLREGLTQANKRLRAARLKLRDLGEEDTAPFYPVHID